MTTTQQLPQAETLPDLLRIKALAGLAAVVLLLAGGAFAAVVSRDGARPKASPTVPAKVSPQVARLTAEAALGLRVGAPVPQRYDARVAELANQIERGRAVGTPIEP
jgi:hypothetical protein